MNKALSHLHTINKHKLKVTWLCFRCHLYKQGLLHDLSKYSYIELKTGFHYYQGFRSPIDAEKEEKGYSLGWLHHKGRNKHHWQYWYDSQTYDKTPIIPYKYTIEMLCDNLSAGMVYRGKDFTNDYPLWYWNNVKNKELFHPKLINFFDDIFNEISNKGIKEVLNKRHLKEKYNKYCN